ncbi:MAG: hypothetical protein KGN80_07120 [Acidobacteriota bacterium]|nr:hypothetical protein [Acidobacteriota bacterium]
MRAIALSLLIALPLVAQAPSPVLAPRPDWFPSKNYQAGIPLPNAGKAYTHHGDLVAYASALAAAAPERVKLLTLNITEEGRPQPFLIISSPANIANLEQLRSNNAKLADPRACGADEAERIVHANPVFVWLGYSIHGAEPSGSEAALAVAYHYAAALDEEVIRQLDRVVLLLDLTQNPDGRERAIQAVSEALQGTNPSDPQDAQNTGRWPGGRFNHRLFDLNRDWAWQTQGESRAKAAAFLRWSPQVLADHHEMSAESSYYFPPTMQPVHDAIPTPFSGYWQQTFGKGVARAFDAHEFTFFSKDIFDLFYPSYGDSWPSLHGAVGMTFEMAGQVGLAYRRRDGDILTLENRVQRHFTASLATVLTASENREALLMDFQKARRERMNLGERAGAFFIAQGPDPGRSRALVELLRRNGIEVQRTTEAFSAANLEPIGVGVLPVAVKPGSYIVTLDQPLGPLAEALLQKEAKMGLKPSYDVTGWSLPLTFNVPTWHAKVRPKVGTGPLAEAKDEVIAEARSAYILPAGFEGREPTLAALLNEGFRGAVATESFGMANQRFEPGAVIFPLRLNDGAKLLARIKDLAARNHHPVVAADSTLSDSGPDLGSDRVYTLKAPKVAVLVDRPVDPTALGAVMHTLRETGIRFSQVRADRFGEAQLHRYSHIILVDDNSSGKGWQRILGEGGAAKLKAWTMDGGVLLGLQGGAVYASRAGLADAGFQFLSKEAEEARLKEKDAKREIPKPDAAELIQPWSGREQRDLQETIPGALLHVKVDLSHPLAWGLHTNDAAVLDTSDSILELSPGGENPIYYPGNAKKDSKNIPEGEPLKISGLLPKALEPRLRLTSYALREHHGAGAVILFAGDPVFRGMSAFTTRMFLNAVFFGAYRAKYED